MRYAIDVAPLGDLADPVAIVRLAVAAECRRPGNLPDRT